MQITPNENRCIACGKVIPEGRHVCLLCASENDVQSFEPRRPSTRRPMKYFHIVDDCGWDYYIASDRPDLIAANIVLLTPHVRKAAEITRREYENMRREDDDTERISDAVP